MNTWKRLINPLASLRLTVILLLLLLLLVFVSTLAQRFMGIWEVMDVYYKAPIAWFELRCLLPVPPQEIDPAAGTIARLYHSILNQPEVWRIPLPGGLLLGILLLLNLLAAHAVRFVLRAKGHKRALGLSWLLLGSLLILAVHHWPPLRQVVAYNVLTMLTLGVIQYLPMTWGCWLLFGKKAGIFLVHLALIVLILGEGVARFEAVEMRLGLAEGQTDNTLYDMRHSELAVIIHHQDNTDQVVRIPEHLLRSAAEGQVLSHADLPVHIEVLHWHDNTELRRALPHESDPLSTLPTPAGRFALQPVPSVSGLSGQMHNRPGMVIRLRDGQGWQSEPITLATGLMDMAAPGLGLALFGNQRVHPRRIDTPEGAVGLALRPVRHPLPFELRLEKVEVAHYPGSNIPRHYASSMTLIEEGRHRPVYTSMNKPWRHAGLTFFQSGVSSGITGTGASAMTILQVVRNPGWAMPYIACGLAGVGLVLQFMISLIRFAGRERNKPQRHRGHRGSTEDNSPSHA